MARDAQRYAVWIAQGYTRTCSDTPCRRDWDPAAAVQGGAVRRPLSHHDATHSHNPGGVTYGKVERDHPDWILRDRNGQPIHSTRYHGYVLMDVGNRGTSTCGQPTSSPRPGATAGAACWPTTWPSPSTRPGRAARYASTLRWQAAVRSFLVVVGRQLREAGLVLVANIASGVSYPAVRRSWLWTVDGTMEEGWMRPNVSASAPLASAPGDWNRQLQELLDSEARQRLFLAELPASSRDQRHTLRAHDVPPRCRRLHPRSASPAGRSTAAAVVRGLRPRARPRAAPRPARPDGTASGTAPSSMATSRQPDKGAHVVTAARGPAIRLPPQTGVIVLHLDSTSSSGAGPVGAVLAAELLARAVALLRRRVRLVPPIVPGVLCDAHLFLMRGPLFPPPAGSSSPGALRVGEVVLGNADRLLRRVGVVAEVS